MFVFSVLAFQFLFLAVNIVKNAIQTVAIGNNLSNDMARPVFSTLLHLTIGYSVDLLICVALFVAVLASFVCMVGIKFEK